MRIVSGTVEAHGSTVEIVVASIVFGVALFVCGGLVRGGEMLAVMVVLGVVGPIVAGAVLGFVLVLVSHRTVTVIRFGRLTEFDVRSLEVDVQPRGAIRLFDSASSAEAVVPRYFSGPTRLVARLAKCGARTRSADGGSPR